MRARPRPDFDPYKLDHLVARAHHDGFARYRDAARSPGTTISDCAKDDNYRRYDTGEPHPLDGCRTRI
eukprot:4285357-Pleurochrysis_carterae.AAC.1